MPTATATYGPSLQQGHPLPRRRGSCDLVSLAIGLERVEILLELLPGDVAGMGVRDAGEPIIALAGPKLLLSIYSPPILPPAIDVRARVARIVQRPDRGRYRQRLENRWRLVADARRKAKSLFAKDLHG